MTTQTPVAAADSVQPNGIRDQMPMLRVACYLGELADPNAKAGGTHG